jgi:hypothetical protein
MRYLGHEKVNLVLTIIFIYVINIEPGFSFTLNNNISAGFPHRSVGVFVTANSSCNNAQVTKEQLLSMVSEAISQYWNTVPTSSLRLFNGGLLNTSNNDFITGHLCSAETSTPCVLPVVPKVNDIVISCNTNKDDNFPNVGANPSSILAITLPNNVNGGSIIGSAIIINDTPDTRFRDLSWADQVAVIAHEIGHAIGLGHSPSRANLMYADVVPVRHSLGRGDIKGVSYLYPVKFDGCGLFGTISEPKSDQYNFLYNLIFGLLFSLIMIKLINFINSKKHH